jgi:hypothetical protein
VFHRRPMLPSQTAGHRMLIRVQRRWRDYNRTGTLVSSTIGICPPDAQHQVKVLRRWDCRILACLKVIVVSTMLVTSY